MNILRRMQLPATGPDGTVLVNLSRRQFLQGAGGLVIGLSLGTAACSRGDEAGAARPAADAVKDFEPNAFLRIGSDDSVTVIAKHLEMGQGSYTGLATLIAEELDADWSQLRVEGAPADAKRYANLFLGSQLTGGSSAMANSFEQMRKAGAAARSMLVAAAAQAWSVPADSLSVENGVISHKASGRSARFGEMAQAAAGQPVPQDPPLKSAKDFKLIGKRGLARKDSAEKVDGSAVFTQDLKLPDMLVAVVAHPPRFGAVPGTFDPAPAKAVQGVVEVFAYPGGRGYPAGVAVLARNTWIAKRGRDALKIEWDESKAFKLGSAEIMEHYRSLAGQEGLSARQDGDALASLAVAAKVIEADYEFPYLAHSAMEPLNCLVKLDEQHCEIWNGEQMQTMDQAAVAQLLGLKPEQVTLHQLYAGGSFGRRANPSSDYLLEAVSIARVARGKGHAGPVKLVWMREEDTTAGYYRPAFLHRMRAGLDAEGKVSAWHQRIVGQDIAQGSPMEAFMTKDGIASASVEGAGGVYEVPNLRVELHTPKDIGVPVQWWRSVGHTHTAYATECLIDELASAAKRDPVDLRRTLLTRHPRHLGALELAAEKAGWSQSLPAGGQGVKRGRGVAVHESFNTYVAQVVEVTVKSDGSLKVDRVVCAVDCGTAINPDVIRAQMEGGIGFALSAALHGQITLKDGVVEQSNFHQYAPLRINEMPAVEVYIVESGEKPTGVGEPGVPPLAPALANAIFAATGKRIRKLPIADQLAA